MASQNLIHAKSKLPRSRATAALVTPELDTADFALGPPVGRRFSHVFHETPVAVLKKPMVFVVRAWNPVAVLSCPVVLNWRASRPSAVLWLPVVLLPRAKTDQRRRAGVVYTVMAVYARLTCSPVPASRSLTCLHAQRTSLSKRPSGIAAQFNLMIGPPFRAL